MQRTNQDTRTSLLISQLPELLRLLLSLLQDPYLAEARLFLHYLRHKPGRGLVALYRFNRAQFISLALDERAIEVLSSNIAHELIDRVQPEITAMGNLHIPDLGITLQLFPQDEQLPSLPACYDTIENDSLHGFLQTTVHTYLQDQGWQILHMHAAPVRYKPASRCVIRYHLDLFHAARSEQRSLTLFGKLYAHSSQARALHTIQQHLYSEQEQTGELPLLPRPLGLQEDQGLTLQEAVATYQQQDGQWHIPVPGIRVLRARITYEREGIRPIVPRAELELTAQALARLHTSKISLNNPDLRTEEQEAKKVQERARLLRNYYPALAQEIHEQGAQLSRRLAIANPQSYRMAHGGFKPAQLLFDNQHVFVVDFDGACVADPALDIGYFLAYLRPGGLWYARPGMRAWFQEAEHTFCAAYRQATRHFGPINRASDSIFARSNLYAAALIFKIATRRVHRLNSPRPQELTAMLSEIRLLQEGPC